jgi:hypothetical protein
MILFRIGYLQIENLEEYFLGSNMLLWRSVFFIKEITL